MQTAQLTFNGRTITDFFVVLFLFRCREKVRDTPNSPRSVICWDLFLHFLGDTLVLQMGDTVGPRYTAPKISAISYLFRIFSLFIHCNGRHRTTALYRFPRSIGPRYNGAAVYCKSEGMMWIEYFTPDLMPKEISRGRNFLSASCNI